MSLTDEFIDPAGPMLSKSRYGTGITVSFTSTWGVATFPRSASPA